MSRLDALKRSLLALPTEARALVLTAMALLMLGTLFVVVKVALLWSDALGRIEAAEPSIARLQGYTLRETELVDAVLETKNAYAALLFSDAAGSGSASAELQQKLRQLASENGLSVTGSEVENEVASESSGLTKLRVILNVVGSTLQFDQFLLDIYSTTPAMFIDKLQLSTVRPAGSRRPADVTDDVRAQMTVSAYRASVES